MNTKREVSRGIDGRAPGDGNLRHRRAIRRRAVIDIKIMAILNRDLTLGPKLGRCKIVGRPRPAFLGPRRAEDIR